VIGPATNRARGNEREEPIEPPQGEECYLRVVGGSRALDSILADLKRILYEYNRVIRSTGYYLKPVHKVYKYSKGSRRVYEYYGRYWWKLEKRGGRVKFIYAGLKKPARIKVSPPRNPLEGLSIIREGEDILIKCSDFEKFSSIFRGFKILREA